MNKLFVFAAFVSLFFIMFTIVNIMISLNIRSKQEIVEQYDSKDVLVQELDKNIKMYRDKVKVLENALNVLKQDNTETTQKITPSTTAKSNQIKAVKPTVATRTTPVVKQTPVVKKTILPNPSSEQRLIDSLTEFEKSLGQSFINVKNSQANYSALLKRVMKQIGLTATNDDYKNYCMYRSAIGACQIGRTDCKDYCNNHNDPRGNIFG